jgi:hypothetical protein
MEIIIDYNRLYNSDTVAPIRSYEKGRVYKILSKFWFLSHQKLTSHSKKERSR